MFGKIKYIGLHQHGSGDAGIRGAVRTSTPGLDLRNRNENNNNPYKISTCMVPHPVSGFNSNLTNGLNSNLTNEVYLNPSKSSLPFQIWMSSSKKSDFLDFMIWKLLTFPTFFPRFFKNII